MDFTPFVAVIAFVIYVVVSINHGVKYQTMVLPPRYVEAQDYWHRPNWARYMAERG